MAGEAGEILYPRRGYTPQFLDGGKLGLVAGAIEFPVDEIGNDRLGGPPALVVVQLSPPGVLVGGPPFVDTNTLKGSAGSGSTHF